MSVTLTTGSTLAIAKTYGPSIATTTVTNASDAVVTTASPHSVAVGEYVEVLSGWGRLNQRIARAKTGTTGSTLVLEGINTSDTSKYPSGTGLGSIRRISAWTALSQIKSLSASGGTQNYADITDMTDTVERKVPTTRSAIDVTIDAFDDPSLNWYADVVTADESRSPYGFLITPANSKPMVANAYWSLLRVPTMAQNEALMTQINLSYAAEPVRYAS
jgi:hypothetical protein